MTFVSNTWTYISHGFVGFSLGMAWRSLIFISTSTLFHSYDAASDTYRYFYRFYSWEISYDWMLHIINCIPLLFLFLGLCLAWKRPHKKLRTGFLIILFFLITAVSELVFIGSNLVLDMASHFTTYDVGGDYPSTK